MGKVVNKGVAPLGATRVFPLLSFILVSDREIGFHSGISLVDSSDSSLHRRRRPLPPCPPTTSAAATIVGRHRPLSTSPPAAVAAASHGLSRAPASTLVGAGSYGDRGNTGRACCDPRGSLPNCLKITGQLSQYRSARSRGSTPSWKSWRQGWICSSTWRG